MIYILIMKITDAILEAKIDLEKHRNRTDIKLDELVQIANRIINLVVPHQPSERVTEILNERTLRYYISEGLIERPMGKEGTSALYGYKHLLQALVVKALQSAYLPIKRIGEILKEKDVRELEAILTCQTLETPNPLDAMAEESKGKNIDFARHKVLSYLDYLEGSSQPKRVDAKFSPEKSSPEKLMNQEPILNQHSLFRRLSFQKKNFPASDSWERFPLDDGIELHVRADRVKGLRNSEINKILERLLNFLKTRT